MIIGYDKSVSSPNFIKQENEMPYFPFLKSCIKVRAIFRGSFGIQYLKALQSQGRGNLVKTGWARP